MSDEPATKADLRAIEARLPSAETMAAINALIERDKHAAWFWATTRTWALWFTAIAAAVTVAGSSIKAAIRGMFI